MEIKNKKKLKLHGFNNLTKSLSFNMYDFSYARTLDDRRGYIAYIDEEYNAERLSKILTSVSDIIGANILNVSTQDYDPQGASVAILISEGHELPPNPTHKEDVVMHLDKSHITAHTYPEVHPEDGICTFRADIEVSTCGQISPLKALNYLIHSFYADVMTIDYRVRGFTRDVNGKKIFIDHKINSIQNYILKSTRNLYQWVDVNVYQEKIFHTKAMLKRFKLENYLFGASKKDLLPAEKDRVKKLLKREMAEVFYGQLMYKM